MSYAQPNTFLRYALLADAIASGATGLLLIAGGCPSALSRPCSDPHGWSITSEVMEFVGSGR